MDDPTVVRGPWPSAKVAQTITEANWWHRDGGVLFVRCGVGAVRRAPVPMADLTQPIPNRAPNRRRITMALDLRGLDGPEVDEALGVNDALDTVVDSWEAGTVVPSIDDIRRLATLTGMLPHWFYQEDCGAGFDMGFICGPDGCRVLGVDHGLGTCPTCGGPR